MYLSGLTPFQLAAHKNDYVMLRILHDHGYGSVSLYNFFCFFMLMLNTGVL